MPISFSVTGFVSQQRIIPVERAPSSNMKKLIQTLTIVLIFGLACLSVTAQNFFSEPVAQQGILDLRQTDLSAHSVALNGQWHFYWKQLLEPSDSLPAKNNFANYPALWNDMEWHGNRLTSNGYATYLLTVFLPKNKPTLALQIPDTYSSYKLFVNGVLFAQNGSPDSIASKATPFWTTDIFVISKHPDTLNLVLQVANFWHAKGGTYKSIIIGEKTQLLLNHHRDTAIDLLLAGCLFMGGLFFLGLFIFGKNDQIILYFSLLCIVTSYRMIGTDLYVLHSLFPGLNWYISIRLEYITLVAGVALFSQYTRMLFPKDTLQILMKAVIWLCVIYSLIILTMPAVVFSSLLIIFLGVMFAYIAYCFYIYIQAVRNKRSGSIYALLSSGVMLLVYLLSNLHYFGIIEEHKAILFAGYIAFFFLQSLVLSHRFSHLLQQAGLQAQQGLIAKEEFLSTMSHEIRTPLNSVIGMTHILQRSEPRKDQKEQLDVLMFSANNLLSIVNNILDYSKIEAGKISIEKIDMDIPAIGRHIVSGLKSIANEKRLSLIVEIDDQLKQKVLGDPTRTSQVINNLLHNAIKFTREGYVLLSIKIEKIEGNFITVKFSIKDSGIGIEVAKQGAIFERFTQADSSTSRSYGGTGLGLSISKKILELQGSLLQVKSIPGKGSEFYFSQTFTISHEKVKEPETTPASGPEQAKLLEGISILLVEDNPMNVLVAQTFLERCGAGVDIAVNGEEALTKFVPFKYQLVLMDLNMPLMDGYEATRQIRKKGGTLPIIALTASLPKEVESEVYEAGLTDIIVKPFNPEDFFRTILLHCKPAMIHPYSKTG